MIIRSASRIFVDLDVAIALPPFLHRSAHGDRITLKRLITTALKAGGPNGIAYGRYQQKRHRVGLQRIRSQVRIEPIVKQLT
jgi:hypothetical protein